MGEQLDLLHTRQLEDSTARLELDPAHQVEYSALDDEIYIGGIYVRLFLQNPQFDIRRPEKFIEVRSPYCVEMCNVSHCVAAPDRSCWMRMGRSQPWREWRRTSAP